MSQLITSHGNDVMFHQSVFLCQHSLHRKSQRSVRSSTRLQIKIERAIGIYLRTITLEMIYSWFTFALDLKIWKNIPHAINRKKKKKRLHIQKTNDIPSGSWETKCMYEYRFQVCVVMKQTKEKSLHFRTKPRVLHIEERGTIAMKKPHNYNQQIYFHIYLVFKALYLLTSALLGTVQSPKL